MATFPKYRGELPECLNPFNIRHYWLLAYWIWFRPTAIQTKRQLNLLLNPTLK